MLRVSLVDSRQSNMVEGAVSFKPEDPELCKKCKGVLGCVGKWVFMAGEPTRCPFTICEKDGEDYMRVYEALIHE